jgi:two-component system, sensor histidine kinase
MMVSLVILIQLRASIDTSPMAFQYPAPRSITWFLGLVFVLTHLGASSPDLMSTQVVDDGVIVAIHSYQPGYSWTDRQLSGMMDALDDEVGRNRVFHEFLDAKRVEWGAGYVQYLDYLDFKYGKNQILALVVTDDHALNCALRYRERRGKDFPVFFSGINVTSVDELPMVEAMTGVIENLDVQQTVDFALRHFPSTKSIYVLGEYSLSGDLIFEGVARRLELPDGVALVRLQDLPFSDQLAFLSSVDGEAMILVLPYSRDGAGAILDQADAVEQLASSVRIPVWISYHFSLCESMVGGWIFDSYDHARRMGQQLKQYLEGTPIEEIPVVSESPGRWVFSSAGMKQHGLRQADLPRERELLHSKEPTFIRYLVGLVLALLFIALQAALIVVLLRSRRRLKLLTRELRESREQLRSWLLHAPLPVGVFRRTGELIAINHEFVDLLGYKEEDFSDARSMWRLMIPEAIPLASALDQWNLCEQGNEGKRIVPLELKVVSKEGRPKVVEVHIAIYRGSIICFFNDVSWRWKIENDLERALNQAHHANVAKSHFLANMSHEIRTPMNGVLGMAQLLAETSVDEEQEQYVRTIQKSGELLLSTINNILDLSKIEAGQVSMESIPFDLVSCIEDAVAVCLPRLRRATVRFEKQLPQDLPSRIVGDPFRLTQVTVNLLSNAIKYTEMGLVRIEVSSVALGGTRVRLRIMVKDSGIGIAKEKQQSVFDPFVQADASITREFGGSGLGLTICKRIAERMGANLGLVSEPGVGSEFFLEWETDLEIPVSNAHADAVIPEPEGEKTRTFTTLVVEDNPVNLKVIELSLKRFGIIAQTACNGQQAVNLLRERPFDLVFMDIQMPVLDGLAATRVIRTEFPHDQQPFVIALTAHALLEHREQCRHAQMNAFIAKPFTTQDLREVLELFHKHRSGDPFLFYS